MEDMDVDINGNVALCGNTQLVGGDFDYFTSYYNNLGQKQWTNIYEGSQSYDLANSVVIHSSGEVTVTGKENPFNATPNITTITYLNNGSMKWIQQNYDNPVGDFKVKLSADNSGGVYLLTTVQGNTSFDLLTLCYNNKGVEVWNRVFDKNNSETATDLASDPFGNVYVVGQSFDGINYKLLAVKYGLENKLIPPDYYGESPSVSMSYYINKGQISDTNGTRITDVKFHSTTGSPALFLQNNKISNVIYRMDTISNNQDSVFRYDFRFNNESPQGIIGYGETEDLLYYYLGKVDGGRQNINGFSRIIYPDVDVNIDVHVSSNLKGAKYNFVMNPGSKPNLFEFNVDGADSIFINNFGELEVKTAFGNMVYPLPNAYQTAPPAYQVINVPWHAGYVLNNNKVSFSLGAYDTSLALIIQMDLGQNQIQQQSNGNLDWSTYYNGTSSDYSFDVTVDPSGATYLVGKTQSADFQVTNGLSTYKGNYDGFIIKFNKQAERVWAMFYGGSQNDEINAVSYNTVNNMLYCIGTTTSNNLKIEPTSNPNNGTYYQNIGYGNANPYNSDAFILKVDPNTLNQNQKIPWATYFSGNGNDEGIGVICDPFGDVHITGNTTTAGGSNNCQALTNGLFPLCDPAGTTDYHQSFNAGSGDIFVAKFDQNNFLTSSTFFGSNVNDAVNSIKLKSLGQNGVYITGHTSKTFNSGVITCSVPANGNFPLCQNNAMSFTVPDLPELPAQRHSLPGLVVAESLTGHLFFLMLLLLKP